MSIKLKKIRHKIGQSESANRCHERALNFSISRGIFEQVLMMESAGFREDLDCGQVTP